MADTCLGAMRRRCYVASTSSSAAGVAPHRNAVGIAVALPLVAAGATAIFEPLPVGAKPHDAVDERAGAQLPMGDVRSGRALVLANGTSVAADLLRELVVERMLTEHSSPQHHTRPTTHRGS